MLVGYGATLNMRLGWGNGGAFIHVLNDSGLYLQSTVNGSASTGGVAVGLGAGTSLGGRLHVRGTGTTSSTTAFLVQNSNASSSLVVRDDQVIILSGDTTTPAGTLPGGYFTRDTYDGRSTYVLRIGETIGNDLYIGANAASSYFLSLQANRKVRIGHYSSGTADVEIGYNGTTNSIRNLRPAYFASGSYITGSVAITGSAGTGSALLVYKSGSTVVDVQGSQGQLFSIVDALSGSLMSVNDISGLPILEVFSDDRVVMGTYGAPGLTVTGSTVIASGSFSGSFFGNGSGLTNISASSIVGLNLSQIATGSISASVSTGTGSFTVSSGSTSFLFVSSSGNVGIGTLL
jgi:hypothetical protein